MSKTRSSSSRKTCPIHSSPRMIRAFKQTTKKEETAALFSLVISLVALDGSDSCALHVNFSVVHFLIHVVLVFSHVAVGIDARATYRVRVVWLISPKVIWFYRKKEVSKQFWVGPKFLRLLSRLYLLTVCLVLRHLICAMQRIGQMFVSSFLFVCLFVTAGLFFCFELCLKYETDKQTKLETPFSRF